MSLRALSTALGLGDDPQAILRDIHSLYEAVDKQLSEASLGLDLPCKPGCDACCHESVFVSAPEFLAVAAELARTGRAESAVTQMVKIAGRFEDELELLESIEAGAERDEVAARVKFRCPLLSDVGQCSVYRARELNGRTFGQSWDDTRDEAYGCSLTHERLAVIGRSGLPDARQARRQLMATVPKTSFVHVYPWWFAKYGRLVVEAGLRENAVELL